MGGWSTRFKTIWPLDLGACGRTLSRQQRQLNSFQTTLSYPPLTSSLEPSTTFGYGTFFPDPHRVREMSPKRHGPVTPFPAGSHNLTP